MKPMDFRSRWVLVTGASSGLGREMALQLALRHGANLILAARRLDRLQEIEHQITSESPDCGAVCIQADLSQEQDRQKLFEQAIDGRDIYGVILNAGITYFGPHLDLPWEQFEKLLDTNVVSNVRLTNLFLPYLIEKDQGGGLMLVTSLTGMIPAPFQTAYSASKAFLTTFGRGLYHELRQQKKTNVSVTTFVPGGIMTEMTETSGLSKSWSTESIQIQCVDDCACEGLGAFAARRYLAVPGVFNRVQLLFSPLVSRRFLGNRMAAVFDKALRADEE